MGVLHPDFLCPRRPRPIDSGDGFTGHNLTKLLPIGVVLLGLIPMGYARHAFNIYAYVNFHCCYNRGHDHRFQ